MGSGGGVSGAVDFPDYIENTHRLMLFGDVAADSPINTDLTISMLDVMQNALELPTAGNPLDGAAYTSPSTVLGANDTAFDLWFDWVKNLDPTDAGNVATAVEDKYDTLVEYIKTHLVNNDWLKNVDPSAYFAALDTSGLASINNFHNTFASGLDENVDLEAIIDAIVTKLAESGVLSEISAASIVTQAVNDATQLMERSIEAALEVISNVDIDAIIEAFEARVETTKQRNLREFHSGMADINAVHSTAFIWGNAIIENDATLQVAAYRQEIEQRLYEMAIQSYGAGFGNALQGRLQVAVTNTTQRQELMRQGIGFGVQLLLNRTNYQTAFADLYSRLLGGQLDARVRAELHNSAAYVNKLTDAAKDLVQMFEWHIGERKGAVALKTEQNRIRIVALREHESADFDLDYKHALWPFDVYHRGANILAAPAGMSAPLPDKPSAISSALGGALGGAASGAAIGSVVPGIGTAIGAGIGALAGGLAGLLG